MKAKELCEDIRSYCRENADEAVVKKYSKYFKEGYDAYGVSRELLADKVKSLLSDKDVDMKVVLNASRRLVKSGKYEETSFAIRLLKGFSQQFDAGTFAQLEKWFEIGIINWAHTYVICGDLISQFLEREIVPLQAISDWRTATNKFQRRAVPVVLIKPLKSGGDHARLLAFIEPLMLDGERVVHQGLGWFLREAWKLDRKQTEAFLLKWKNDAPRLIFQYATEKTTSFNSRSKDMNLSLRQVRMNIL
ncbi:MAG: DNA alkylation repair protein [Planctomycetes bacterium]|nr:DNA alkylation repair protein [Planctomycetota bacterium]MBL7186499.1 DNA alkylation repair protein [Phycisphaerae bacterium]